MKKLKEYWAIILLAICFLGLSFYWFELRPAKIRSDCAYKTAEVANNAQVTVPADQLRIFLDVCLMKGSLKK